MNMEFRKLSSLGAPGKFQDPTWTADGKRRAEISLDRLDMLWINTGTLCNIACVNCYIASSPTNDQLVYISTAEVTELLDEIPALALPTREIGFTGGEPFLNPDMLVILRETLMRGFNVLVLTNAMQPMQRPRIKDGLLELQKEFHEQLTLRVSLDHYAQALHERERGPGTWASAVDGLNWLSVNGFKIAIAGRTCWGEQELLSRKGYAELIEQHGWALDSRDTTQLMLLPEMDGSHDVSEISTACWDILAKSPSDQMCASSRMVVKRKGAEKPTIVPCTLLPYASEFDMGVTLAEAFAADGGMFSNGAVKLCHPHCAKFCVLGGGSCS